MSQLKTVKIKDPKTPEGYRIINAADFDAANHEPFAAPKKAPQKSKKTPTSPGA